MAHTHRIIPVILSGGTGSRLWPLSRADYPKQFLPLVTDEPMLIDTLRRVDDPQLFEAPVIIANEAHRFIVGEALRRADLSCQRLIIEPAGRNTAPAIAAAALYIQEKYDPETVMLALPSDHFINDAHSFRQASERGAEAAAGGTLVCFGILPDRPETGYGYIQPGPGTNQQDIRGVRRFTEKPDASAAQVYIEQGCLWNSGMFALTPKTLLKEMRAHRPDIVEGTIAALEQGHEDLDFFRLDKTAFEKLENISIDYAVMEKTEKAQVLPVDIGWSDMGSYGKLWECRDKDADGNAVSGPGRTMESRDNFIHSDGPLIAAAGVQDLAIVAGRDAVLVAPRDQEKLIEAMVQKLRADGVREVFENETSYRPWGSYRILAQGPRFQVKEIEVLPGKKLSLQKHFHRAEHWTGVQGTGLVVRDDEEIILYENESIYIPAGAVHRISNPGKITLTFIEVQTGSYLAEDDIVRIEDEFQRV